MKSSKIRRRKPKMLRLGTKEIRRLSSPQQEKRSSQQLQEMSKKLS